MRKAIGMPDLHPGKDAPIGAVFAGDLVYPHLVGNDIGCGMALWQTDLRNAKIKLDKWVRRLTGLEGPWDGDVSEFMSVHGVAATEFDSSLGTIGGGNHFAELQRVQKIADQHRFASMGLDAKALFLLVHSGSRGFGESILHANAAQFGNRGHDPASPEGIAYLGSHEHATRWAKANRHLIATRFMEALGTRGNCVLDVCHNCVQQGRVDGQPCWLHRKGAAPSDVGPVVIPGSRGSLSYLVTATGDQEVNLATLAHGAGRKWRRGECRGRLEKRFSQDDLIQTELGSRVICEDKDLLFEEAPPVYKNVDIVVNDLVEAGVVSVVATFAPLITYKKRKEEEL
jgi:release factor H-coupled RctB family protein